MNGIGRKFTTDLHAAFDASAGRDNVTLALRILRGTRNPETVPETEKWIRQCDHRPSLTELRLHACDTLLGTHGVESIGEIDMRHGAPVQYLNTGDSYATTLIYYRGRARQWALGCWADVAEKMEG